MLNADLSAVVGTPGDDVTHWAISRVPAGKLAPARGEWTRCEHPREDGARLREWPIESLSLSLIRDRWGSGSFKIHWLALDADNPQSEHRRVSKGNGPVFTIDAPPVEEAPVVPAAALPALPRDVEPMTAAFSFAQSLMALADQRTNATIEAVSRMAGGGSHGGGNAEVLAQLAELRAKMTADEERRKLEDAHREAVRLKDAEIERLKRELAEAEREEPAAPMFQPGESIWQTLGLGVLNAAASNPAAAATVLAPILSKLMPQAPPQAAPQAAPSLPPAPPAAPPPVRQAPPVRVIARPPVDPLTPAQTAVAADPAPPAQAPPVAS